MGYNLGGCNHNILGQHWQKQRHLSSTLSQGCVKLHEKNTSLPITPIKASTTCSHYVNLLAFRCIIHAINNTAATATAIPSHPRPLRQRAQPLPSAVVQIQMTESTASHEG